LQGIDVVFGVEVNIGQGLEQRS